MGNELFAALLREAGWEDALSCLPADDLKVQYPLQRLGNIFSALESLAGKRAQNGVLQRSGRACFHNLQRRSTPPLGIFTAGVLTLPKRLKVKRCGEILADYFQRYMRIDFLLEPSQDALKWGFSIPEQDVLLGDGLASLWFGFWSELLYTLSGGKPHLLEFTPAAGASQPLWVIRIPYLPFEG
ncbi:MAG: hypothetical protein ACK44E_08805 [Anaerolineales bacterium]